VIEQLELNYRSGTCKAVLPWRSPRQLLFSCAALDLTAIFCSVALSNLHQKPNLLHPPLVIGLVGFTYCLLGWLLGSYTVLRWPWLRLRLVLQRLALTALATLTGLILFSWGLGVDATQLNLLNRGVLLEVMGWQTLLALAIRLQLRLLNRTYPQARWRLMAQPQHQRDVIREWQRNPFVRPPQLISPDWLEQPASSSLIQHPRPLALAVADGIDLDIDQQSLISHLRSRGVLVTSLEELAQRQLERLPPTLLPKHWLNITELPWSNEFSLQRKLKRFGDLLIASLLILFTTPLMVLASLAIWLEDLGPVLYVQTRTGWMGHPFQLLKLRTMRVSSPNAPTPWTRQRDQRVTRVGVILRRTRLDELPQLINVLQGQMSLIGPRPEQPGMDEKLALTIPHYNKRYWMLPGLSGWAQVCGPAYPASLEESELKLSYDLFYLRNWSLSLDLLILAKTIKTLLKIRGI